MNINYEFLYSGIPAGEENAVTGLLVTDTDTSKTYILQIPLTDVTPSEGKVGPFDLTEVESDTLIMLNAATLFQTKNVNPMLEGQEVQPDTGYVGLAQVNVAAVPVETKTVDASATQSVVVTPGSGYLGISQLTVNQIPLETKTVKSNTAEDQTITPTEGKVGISQITVQKFDGESGNPEAAYADGDEIYLKSIPAKFLNRIDRVAEFDGYYKAVVSDNNKSYANAQIVYADESFGPRIPMYNLIGKVPIVKKPMPKPVWSGYRVTLKPVSGVESVQQEWITDGEWFPFEGGKLYNVDCDGTLYENMAAEISTFTMPWTTVTMASVGNLGALVLRIQIGAAIPATEKQGIVENNYQFFFASASDTIDSMLIGFIDIPKSHTITVTSVEDASKHFTVSLAAEDVRSQGRGYAIPESNSTVSQNLDIAVNKPQDITVDNVTYSGRWQHSVGSNYDEWNLVLDDYASGGVTPPIAVMLNSQADVENAMIFTPSEGADYVDVALPKMALTNYDVSGVEFVTAEKTPIEMIGLDEGQTLAEALEEDYAGFSVAVTYINEDDAEDKFIKYVTTGYTADPSLGTVIFPSGEEYDSPFVSGTLTYGGFSQEFAMKCNWVK